MKLKPADIIAVVVATIIIVKLKVAYVQCLYLIKKFATLRIINCSNPDGLGRAAKRFASLDDATTNTMYLAYVRFGESVTLVHTHRCTHYKMASVSRI